MVVAAKGNKTKTRKKITVADDDGESVEIVAAAAAAAVDRGLDLRHTYGFVSTTYQNMFTGTNSSKVIYLNLLLPFKNVAVVH